MPVANQQARRAEIAKRYQRRDRRSQAERFFIFRQSNLRKLYRTRLGDGPSLAELDLIIDEEAGADWPTASKVQVGRRVQLLFGEKKLLDIRTIAPCDASQEEVQEFYRQKKRARDRRGARARRAAQRANRRPVATAGQRRTAAVRIFLHGCPPQTWVAVGDLCDGLADDPSFRRLARDASRKAVHRALNALAAANEIEEDDISTEQRFTSRMVRLKNRPRR